MLQELQQEINRSVPEKRTRLLRFIYSYCAEEEGNLSRELFTVLAQVAEILIDRIDKETLLEAAETFAHIADTPRSLLRKLAESDLKVATPVLQHAVGLAEEDLIELVKEQTDKYRHCIAGREDLTEPVTDNLITYGDARTHLLVIRNKTAKISRDGFIALSESAKKNDLVSEELSFRGDVPPDLAKALMDNLKKRVNSTRLIGAIETTQKVTIAGAAQKEQFKRQQMQKFSAVALKYIEKLDTEEMSIDDALVELADTGRLREVAEVLAHYAGMSENALNDIMFKVSANRIAELCVSLELTKEAYGAVSQARINKLRLPKAQLVHLTKQYEVMFGAAKG